jgi:adsorption protein B
MTVHLVGGDRPPEPSIGVKWLLIFNAAMLAWRLMLRAGFTGAAYGWRDAWLAVPRAVIGNIIALLAARRALGRYVLMLRGRTPQWDKTAHAFPDDVAEAHRR